MAIDCDLLIMVIEWHLKQFVIASILFQKGHSLSKWIICFLWLLRALALAFGVVAGRFGGFSVFVLIV